MAREWMGAKYASLGIVDDEKQSIGGLAFFSTLTNAPGTPITPVLRPGLLLDMLTAQRPVRIHADLAGRLGCDLLPPDSTSILAVPLSGPARVQGWLLFAQGADGTGFTDEEEQTAVAFAASLTRAYERLEEQRRADEELSDSQQVLESMFESAPDAIAAVNQQGLIVRVNAQTQKLFGYTREQLVGQPVEILVPERFRGSHPMRRQQYSAHPRRRPMGEGLELFGRRKDATEFAVDIMLSPLETKRGKLMLSVIRDATARKQSEERVTELNRSLEKHVESLQAANQELETFSYSVSHDLRAPLRQIDGFARILRERMGPDSDADNSHYLRRIQDAATHMGLLLEGLLDLAKVGRQGLSLRPTDLHALAAQVIEELKSDAPERQIEWILDPLPMLHCDRVLVKAVFTNLLSNAVKFTRLRECAIIRVGCTVKNGETTFSVTDNGVGFNMKYADKLFGVFQRLHRAEEFAGTGVGLATVQRIVKKHGGRIWAEGEQNSSATFFFTLHPGALEPVEDPTRELEVSHG
jgi:PAS domain S-box-containing protein